MAFGCSARSSSVRSRGFISSGKPTCNHRATTDRVVPWISTEVSDTKNTMLKIILALSIPASNGYVAKTIGTAPRNPTQEM